MIQQALNPAEQRRQKEEKAAWQLRSAIELGDWADLSGDAAKLWTVLILFGAADVSPATLVTAGRFAGLTDAHAAAAMVELEESGFTTLRQPDIAGRLMPSTDRTSNKAQVINHGQARVSVM